MWQSGRIRLQIILVVAGLALLASLAFAQQAKPIWGKRIWERKVDDQHRIVVDECGFPSVDNPQQVTRPDYYWRLIENGKEDGPILYIRSGSRLSGIGPALEPIEVLFADYVDGNLLTVFNQHSSSPAPMPTSWASLQAELASQRGLTRERDVCWAIMASKDAGGSYVVRPPRAGRRPASPGVVDNSVGPAMKSAQMQKQADGTLLLTVTDKEDKTHKFQLRRRKDETSDEFWQPVDEK